MKLSNLTVNEITQFLLTGNTVYINKETLEVREVIDSDNQFGFEEDPCRREMIEKIENEWTEYAVIPSMCSVDAFEVMIAFLEEVEDMDFQYKLNKILQRKSPFTNFKFEVEHSAYRQNWLDFRERKYREYLLEMLELEGLFL